jgi:hypothetical protein
MFALSDIPSGTIVAEYRGACVRPSVAEVLEGRYKAAGRDCYFFKVCGVGWGPAPVSCTSVMEVRKWDTIQLVDIVSTPGPSISLAIIGMQQIPAFASSKAAPCARARSCLPM